MISYLLKKWNNLFYNYGNAKTSKRKFRPAIPKINSQPNYPIFRNNAPLRK